MINKQKIKHCKKQEKKTLKWKMQNLISRCINTQNEKIEKLLKSLDNNKKELGRRLLKMMTSTKPCTCKSKHGTKEA
jgi:hypothetical protein